MYCKKCGKDIGDNYSCPFCGYGEKPQKPMHMNSVPKKPQNTEPVQSEVFTPIPPSQSTIMYSDKNKWVAFFLCLFLGHLGMHRFYAGKVKTGVLWLFTIGIFGIGWIVDLITILSNNFKDSHGYVIRNNKTSTQNFYNSTNKKKKGCLFYFVIAIVVLFSISLVMSINFAIKDEKTKSAISSEEWLEFDDKTWEQFSQLYTNHNNLMYAMTAFSDGNMDAASFYSYCKDFESICANNSLIFDYGVNQDQKDYLSVFKSATLSDQMAAQSLMKYLDTYQTSDLSEAQEHIQDAKEAITTIASNRGTLLAKTDLSEEEIQKRLNESLTMLE